MSIKFELADKMGYQGIAGDQIKMDAPFMYIDYKTLLDTLEYSRSFVFDRKNFQSSAKKTIEINMDSLDPEANVEVSDHNTPVNIITQKKLIVRAKLNTKVDTVNTKVEYPFSLDFSTEDDIYELKIPYANQSGLKGENKYAIIFTTFDFRDFYYIIKRVNKILTSSNENYLYGIFSNAFEAAKSDRDKLDIIYEQAPSWVIAKRGHVKVFNDLKLILGGLVDDKFTNEEKAVLNIIKSFTSSSQIEIPENFNPTDGAKYFLENSIIQTVGGKTVLEKTYDKMNNYGGEDNFSAFMKFLWFTWLYTDYPQEIENSNYPDLITLDYRSNKILGFYNSNMNFEWKKNEILISAENDDGIIYKNSSKISIHVFSPIRIPHLQDDDIQLKAPGNVVPAIFLYAIDDLSFWSNLEKASWLSIDVLTTITGFGNLLKLRGLIKLGTSVGKIRIAAGIIEVASGTMSIMLELSNKCDKEGTWCSKLRTYLMWVEMLSLGLDVLSRVSRAAKEAAGSMPSNMRRKYKDVFDHLDEVARNLNSLRLNKIGVDNWIKLIKKHGANVKYFDESEKMLKYSKTKNVGAAFDPSKKPPIIWISKNPTDLELFHESMHFEDFLRRKEKYLQGMKRDVLPLGNKPQVPKRDQLISDYIKEKYVLDKILEEQKNWIAKNGVGRFTEQEIEWSKDYFNTYKQRCIDFNIDFSTITVK